MSWYDQPENFYCRQCQDYVPNEEWNDGLCDHCEEVRKEDEDNEMITPAH